MIRWAEAQVDDCHFPFFTWKNRGTRPKGRVLRSHVTHELSHRQVLEIG